jgi:glycosyltransferase involved in cell wall biosynthesis
MARARLVCLTRNFGQQAAYRAGLDHASGDAVVFLDADLQDPPEAIPEMLAAGARAHGWSLGAGVRARNAECAGCCCEASTRSSDG